MLKKNHHKNKEKNELKRFCHGNTSMQYYMLSRLYYCIQMISHILHPIRTLIVDLVADPISLMLSKHENTHP